MRLSALKNLQRRQLVKVRKVPKDNKRVVVLGVRGGVGASTVAVNLAWLFSDQYNMNTALIDLDLEFGTIALSLDLEPTRGLREALENPGPHRQPLHCQRDG